MDQTPAGINSREWMVAQQTAGTVPHIMPAAQWIIKEDVDKDWWVVLTDSLEEPNPYIAAGEIQKTGVHQICRRLSGSNQKGTTLDSFRVPDQN